MAVKKSRESWGIIDSLPSGRFRARYTHLETRFSAPHTFETKTDARAWLAGIRVDISRGAWKDPRKVSTTTFGPYAEKWIAGRVTTKGLPLRDKTKAEYERQLRHDFTDFLASPLESITPAIVRDWFTPRVQKSATSAARAASLLHAILATAVDDKIIEENPVAKRMTKASSGKKYRPPTLGEMTVLIDNMPEYLQLAIVLAAYGTARISEWRLLNKSHFRFAKASDDAPEYAIVSIKEQALYVKKEWIVGPTKSEAGVREVTLPAVLTPLVRDHLANHAAKGAKGLLFPPVNHHKYFSDDAWRRSWDKARRAAGVMGVVREHDLRGFAGTQYAIAGATIREAMGYLGHSTYTAAMAYQATTGREAELADRMAIPASLLVERN